MSLSLGIWVLTPAGGTPCSGLALRIPWTHSSLAGLHRLLGSGDVLELCVLPSLALLQIAVSFIQQPGCCREKPGGRVHCLPLARNNCSAPSPPRHTRGDRPSLSTSAKSPAHRPRPNVTVERVGAALPCAGLHCFDRCCIE